MAKQKKRKIWLWIVLILLAALLIGGWFWIKSLSSKLTEIDYKTYTAAYGTVTRTITSSGRLAADSTVSVEAESDLVIDTVCVEQGDAVQAGEILAIYDADSIRERIEALYGELSSLDSQLQMRTYADTVTAPTSGRIKALYAKEGDDLETVMQTCGALALLSTDEKMQVDICTDATLAIGKSVSVRYADGRQNGVVANVIENGYRITLTDNNVPLNETAEVYMGEEKIGEGILEIHSPVYIYGIGGTVETVNVKENQMVNAGGKLFTLAEKPLSASYSDALRKREETADEIAALYALLKNPVIVSPCDGVVASVNAREGAAVSGDAFTLHTGGAIKMTVSVDELDIGIVSLGQPARVTLDAFSGETFDASVTHISLLGTSAGSITTYAVELTLVPDERFLEDMNGSATIVAQQKDDVLLIPVEAIYEDETGVYVYVQAGDVTERHDIVTGLSDGANAEIVSGLSAGDVVRYQGTYVSLIDQYQQMGMTGRGGF